MTYAAFALTLSALTLALSAGLDGARAQTEQQVTPAPESIPGVMVVPPPRPAPQPAADNDAEACPAPDLKKLDLIS